MRNWDHFSQVVKIDGRIVGEDGENGFPMGRRTFKNQTAWLIGRKTSTVLQARLEEAAAEVDARTTATSNINKFKVPDEIRTMAAANSRNLFLRKDIRKNAQEAKREFDATVGGLFPREDCAETSCDETGEEMQRTCLCGQRRLDGGGEGPLRKMLRRRRRDLRGASGEDSRTTKMRRQSCCLEQLQAQNYHRRGLAWARKNV